MIKTSAVAAALLAVALPMAASAADMPFRSAPAPVPYSAVPVFTWTGFNVGVDLGYAFNDQAGVFVPANGVRFKTAEADGFAGGLHIGYDHQFGNLLGGGLVLGVVTDASYTGIDQSSTFVDAGNGTTDAVRSRLDYLGTVRGRLGYAFDRFLVYGTGGLAYGNVRYDAAVTLTGIGFPLADVHTYSLETGYVYGGGVEYAIPTASFLNPFNASAVSLKVEYLHYELGSTKATIVPRPGIPFPTLSKIDQSGELVRAGISYRF